MGPPARCNMLDEPASAARRATAAREALLGIFLLATGCGFAWEASDYTLGSARDMGPGYFPLCLGALLALIGWVLVARSALHVDVSRWRADAKELRHSRLWHVALALLAFGIAVEHAGLFVSTLGLVIASSAAGPGFRWRGALPWALCVATFCCALFVVLLGLQLPLWPTFLY